MDTIVRFSEDPNYGQVHSAELIDINSLHREFLNLPLPYDFEEDFLRRCHRLTRFMPSEVTESIYNFKNFSNDNGILLLRNLPVDIDLMKTSSSNGEVFQHKLSFYSEAWLSIAGLLLGDPYGFLQEGSGKLFHNIRPTP